MVVPDTDPDPSYLEQEGFEDRLAQYRNDEFGFVGVRACAEILIPVNGQLIGQAIYSPGLWGIADDSDIEYLNEVGRDEFETLKSMLDELHIVLHLNDTPLEVLS